MTTAESLGGMGLFNAARAAGISFQEEVLPESKTATGDGLQLHYLDWGNHHKPKMLLLHGGAQTAHSWDFFALAMRSEYHIIALDQRGHGDSDWSDAGEYDTPFHTKDIDAVTDAIGFDHFHLVGLSMGGRNAYGFAGAHPEKVKAMVVVDVGPEIEKAGSNHIREFLQDTEIFESFDWLVDRVKRYNPLRPEEQIRGSLINNLKKMDDGRWTWKHDRRRGIGQDRGGEFTKNAWADVAKIQCPTLIVRGELSNIFAPATAQRMLDLIPNSRLVEVPNAGHLVQGDNPVEFEKVVRAFLDTV